ncbi:MAG: hypothetical protein AAGH48_10960 [Pseudomonadota bacterium]
MADIDPIELEALETELPSLVRLRRFALGLDRIPWFANVGEPVTPAVEAAAQAYMDALGFPDAQLGVLRDWEEAAGAAENPDWDAAAWDAEELLRSDLTGRALETLTDEALKLGLAFIASKASDAVKLAVEESAALWDHFDDAAGAAAVGGAVQACHNAALALAAGESDHEFDVAAHAFAHKYQLFEFGRWPIGVVGLTFNMF